MIVATLKRTTVVTQAEEFEKRRAGLLGAVAAVPAAAAGLRLARAAA